MRKKEIIHRIADETGLMIKDVSLVVEGLLHTIRDEVSTGETVYFRGFGKFYALNTKLKGFNFATKKRMHDDDAVVIPRFKAYNAFYDKLENGKVLKNKKNYKKAHGLATIMKQDKVIKKKLMEKPVLSKEQVSQCFANFE